MPVRLCTAATSMCARAEGTLLYNSFTSLMNVAALRGLVFTPASFAGIMGLESVVGLVRNLMEMSATMGDVGEEGSVPSLWSQLPKIVVVGGQVLSSACCVPTCMLGCLLSPALVAHIV